MGPVSCAVLTCAIKDQPDRKKEQWRSNYYITAPSLSYPQLGYVDDLAVLYSSWEKSYHNAKWSNLQIHIGDSAGFPTFSYGQQALLNAPTAIRCHFHVMQQLPVDDWVQDERSLWVLSTCHCFGRGFPYIANYRQMCKNLLQRKKQLTHSIWISKLNLPICLKLSFEYLYRKSSFSKGICIMILGNKMII